MSAASFREYIIDVFSRAPLGAKSAIADACGIRPPTVTKWANGTNIPPRDYWPIIDEHLGLAGDSTLEAAHVRHVASAIIEEVSTIQEGYELTRLGRIEARQLEQAEVLADIVEMLRGVALQLRDLRGSSGPDQAAGEHRP